MRWTWLVPAQVATETYCPASDGISAARINASSINIS